MRAAVAVLCLVAGCAQPAQQRIATGPVLSDTEVRALIRRALESDATGQPADSLYATGASVVSNGRPRLSLPRFAGVARGGVLAIQKLSVEMSPTLAWGSVRYGWASPDGTVEVAEATFVLQRSDRGWRIAHVHSSVPLPWETKR